MNRSFREPDPQLQAQMRQQGRNQLGNNLSKEKEDDLALFLEMRKREKERSNQLFNNNLSEEFDTPIVSKPGRSPVLKIVLADPVRKTATDDFLNCDNDKNDYDWLLSPPGTPLFPSLEMESQKSVPSQIGMSTNRSAVLKSRLTDPQVEPTSRSNLLSRQPTLSPGSNFSSAGIRRPSSSGGRSTISSRAAIPGLSSSGVGVARPSSSGGRSTTSSRPATPTGRPTVPAMSKQPSRPSRPSTPTSRASVPSSKSTAPPARSSTPTGRSANPSSRSSMPSARSSVPSARSSTPSVRSSTPSTRSSAPSARSTTPSARSSAPSTRSTTPSARSSAPSARPSAISARSSTPTIKPTVTASKSTSRTATPTRRPATPSSISSLPGPTRSSSVSKSGPTATRNPLSCGSSPTLRSRPWEPSDMPGFSLDAPPNLRTSLPARPASASRGRPGALSSTDLGSNGRPRRQSCSPSRGRAPNGSVHSSRSSVPASSRSYSNDNDSVNPVLMGTQMVERVVNMRKLAPPRHNEQQSGRNNLTGKLSSSLDSSGFGRNLSKKSLDMAMRHMDIRRSIPGNLRPLMTNIPASSLYSVRSGPTRSRPVSVSDSPLATSSNASSESINNNIICLNGSQVEEDDDFLLSV